MSFRGAPMNCEALMLLHVNCKHHPGRGTTYARTPERNVDANVNARSACVSSPYFGGPAGCSSTFCFETRRPAPRSVFFFSMAGDMLRSNFIEIRRKRSWLIDATTKRRECNLVSTRSDVWAGWMRVDHPSPQGPRCDDVVCGAYSQLSLCHLRPFKEHHRHLLAPL